MKSNVNENIIAIYARAKVHRERVVSLSRKEGCKSDRERERVKYARAHIYRLERERGRSSLKVMPTMRCACRTRLRSNRAESYTSEVNQQTRKQRERYPLFYRFVA